MMLVSSYINMSMHVFQACAVFLSIQVTLCDAKNNEVHFSSDILAESYAFDLGNCFHECKNNCEIDARCSAIAFDRRHLLCKRFPGNITTSDLVKKKGVVAVIFSSTDPIGCNEEVPCRLSGCGVIPRVNKTVVYGNQITEGSKLKYECLLDNVQTYVECLNGGQWSTLPSCTDVKNGGSCNVTTECDEDSTCIDGKCFCLPEYRYNISTEKCDIECNLSPLNQTLTMSTTFLDDYNRASSYDPSTPEECWTFCVSTLGEEALSADFFYFLNLCLCNRVSWHQIIDTDPIKMMSGFSKLVTRYCL